MQKPKNQYLVPCAVIREGDKILLAYKIRSSSEACKNRWELPGSTAGFGLSYEEALKATMREYLGTDIEVIKIYGRVVSHTSEQDNEIRHVFVIPAECRLMGYINLNKEILSEYNWFSLTEAEDLFQKGQLVAGDIEFIRMVLSDARKVS